VTNPLSGLYRYKVLADSPIGRGGCGEVWAAVDRLFDRKVALKTVSDFLLLRDSDRARRSFVSEAIAGARLSERTNRVIAVSDLGFVGELPYYAMEWVENASGIDLGSYLGRTSLRTAKRMVLQAAEGLEVAHANGLAHCDVSPWNILVTANSDIKIADFGLMKLIEQGLVEEQSGSLLRGGRALFQPPSVLNDIENAGYSTDVFALAKTYLALIGGEAAIRGDVPVVVRCVRDQRDAPYEYVRFFHRFITDHQDSDSIADFISELTKLST
jgi:eukaryotic-like serine/threonine-protein kinase